MLSRVQIKQYKCLKDIDVPLQPFNVLIGPNDSGKTSMLEALSALAGVIQTGLTGKTLRDLFHTEHRPLSEFIWHQAVNKELYFRAVYQAVSGATDQNPISQFEYDVNLGQLPHSNDPYFLRESLSVNGEVYLQDLGRDNLWCWLGGNQTTLGLNEPYRTTSLFKFSGLLKQVPHYNQILTIAQVLALVRSYKFDPKALRQPSYISNPDMKPELEMNGAGLPSVLDYLLGLERERFDLIEGRLREIFPQIRRILVQPTKTAQGTGKTLAFALTTSRTEVAAELSSDGLLLLLTYLTVVLGPNPPSLLLIEEPENGIHPQQLKRVAQLLRAVSQGIEGAPPVQVILTTHSPYLLDLAEPDEVLIFTKDTEGATRCLPMTQAKNLEQLRVELSLGELWYNVGEKALITD